MWTKLLKQVIPTPCHDRPFVSDGIPDNCTVIVISENPATELDVDWWSFWSETNGFDYNTFIKHYESTRAKAGKCKVSPTRARLNWIRENKIKCIETNAYKNEKADGAGAGISNYVVLNTLLRNTNNIKAIIAHGSIAHKFVDKANISDGIRIFKTKHFIYVNHDIIDGICGEINAF